MHTQDLQSFETYRPLMFSIAYRMLGSATEAEDILQEAFLRYQGTAQEIVSPKAFLSTIVTRLCLTRLASAQVQRETYLGPWLPEPILMADETVETTHRAELHESLSVAFLVLLEQLTPVERAVFLLRQVFDYEYAEIADILGKDETACRQILSRAKKHIAENRPRFQTDPATHRQILDRFITAVGNGELDGLLQLLSDDVVMWADGGGKARGAAVIPLRGRETVARFVMASPRLATGPLEPRIVIVNGEPALVLGAQGKIFLVVLLSIDQTRIREVRIMGNPDKLKGVNP